MLIFLCDLACTRLLERKDQMSCPAGNETRGWHFLREVPRDLTPNSTKSPAFITENKNKNIYRNKTTDMTPTQKHTAQQDLAVNCPERTSQVRKRQWPFRVATLDEILTRAWVRQLINDSSDLSKTPFPSRSI